MFALIGLVAVAGVVYLAVTIGPSLSALSSFDDKAAETYTRMATQLLATGSPAEATVWKARVKDGLSFEEVDESIKSVAIERNIKGVGELPLSDQVEAMTGEPGQKIKIYMYCNPLTAAKMIEFDIAYAAYLPCRVSLVEDKTGALWIYTLDMDMMIHGGKPLPEELKKEALEVKDIMKAVLKRGAEGDF
ncbi:DUF302 domain-containing protein [Rhodobium gokarnense]|uniref:Uncharacterized protein (DUF302 family) n=1 Tax=Rhodobium gokarnense TaxID=364296 RepID=A0ABT3H7C7_9HYPH|nr:DUF302 domain-containing protein [Rhodobium gokarnense]MCW2306293.1 uncharacterized protein (DUF302 family) [Rhodobium gokarnense]